jgi:NTP pyrophosphatase (non-canonical NTP hydrolase)
MHFDKYQEIAVSTKQKYPQEYQLIVPFLGIIGETGSVISELKKKIRDGDSYTAFNNNLTEELGDVLWYIANIAHNYNIKLSEVAKNNTKKIKDRWDETDESQFIILDESFPPEEQFDREFEIRFVEHTDGTKIKMTIYKGSDQVGDPITDNSYNDDKYRYHDIFHFGYVAFIGWSPVIRKLLKIKRKSRAVVDEVEDGARAAITEELITLLIFQHAQNHDLFKYTQRVDSELLALVQKLVSSIEVQSVTSKQWEKAILSSYSVYHELVKNKGGRVLVSIKNKKLLYLGSK